MSLPGAESPSAGLSPGALPRVCRSRDFLCWLPTRQRRQIRHPLPGGGRFASAERFHVGADTNPAGTLRNYAFAGHQNAFTDGSVKHPGSGVIYSRLWGGATFRS
ncbi:hypothetical protein Bpla01_38630 [Burkholderia plantarii]|nr:hypothetical protein Bpla01_38630 [Burkholderia plantarii]